MKSEIRKEIESILGIPRIVKKKCPCCRSIVKELYTPRAIIDKRKSTHHRFRMKILGIYATKKEITKILSLPHVTKVENRYPLDQTSVMPHYGGLCIHFDRRPQTIKLKENGKNN